VRELAGADACATGSSDFVAGPGSVCGDAGKSIATRIWVSIVVDELRM